jgi:small subunit ribosomal protein S9
MNSEKRQYVGASGKRKTAIARVKLFQDGSGTTFVNEVPLKEYFHGIQIENALAPLAIVGIKGKTDIQAFVEGGGKSAQADAVRHGISRALLLVNPEWRGDLKRAGFLRRDSRTKERKKPGLHRARRAPQFSKR